jgi:Xaa-Pro dipeptidase
MMIPDRLTSLYSLMSSAGLDALVLNPGPSLLYLTGLNFHLMERPTILLIAPPAEPVIILPQLELAKAETANFPLTAYPFGDNPQTWSDVFRTAATALGLDGKSVGVEPTRLRFFELNYLQAAARSAKFISAETVFNQFRLKKDAAEIAWMRRAAAIAQIALENTLPMVKPGVSEREIAAELTINLLRAGSEPELPFAPIVASGPNSANPHAVPDDRIIQNGDLLLFDWGAMYKNYASDITRTFAIGSLSDELRNIYQLVQGANAAGRSAGAPGVRAGNVDFAARGVIQRGNYGAYFTHRTGHGLGMEAHEGPYIFAENDQLLEAGMVYTVEPGIYLPGVGGVRIEDDIVVTENGSASLTDLPRDLTIL